MGVILSRVQKSYRFRIIVERESLQEKRNSILEDEFFKFVEEAYAEPLSVYDDEVKHNVFCLEFSDRELITIMLAHSLQQRRLDTSPLKSLRIPNAIELYKELRDTAQNPPGKRDLIYAVGANVLRKYPFKEIQEKYYSRKLGKKIFLG